MTTTYGNFGTGSIAKLAHIATGRIRGTGYTGITIQELRDSIKLETGKMPRKEQTYAIIRKLYAAGYSIQDEGPKENWTLGKLFESKCFGGY